MRAVPVEGSVSFGLAVCSDAQSATATNAQAAIAAIGLPFSLEAISKGRPSNVETSRCPQTCTFSGCQTPYLGFEPQRSPPCKRCEVCRTTERIIRVLCQRWLQDAHVFSRAPELAALARRPTTSPACLLG